MQKNEKEVVPLAHVFTLLPSCHPQQGEQHKYYTTVLLCLASGLWTDQKGKVDKGMKKKDKDNLLDILVKTRTVKALDEAVEKSSAYQETLKRQDKAFDELDKASLSREQKAIVDRAISAANECGATYGSVAYELGLQDGIKLMSELKEIK